MPAAMTKAMIMPLSPPKWRPTNIRRTVSAVSRKVVFRVFIVGASSLRLQLLFFHKVLGRAFRGVPAGWNACALDVQTGHPAMWKSEDRAVVNMNIHILAGLREASALTVGRENGGLAQRPRNP